MTKLTNPKLLGVFFLCIFCLRAAALEQSVKTHANVMVELAFVSSRVYGDPFNDVSLDVVFTDPANQQLRVPAFWAGSNVWKARYASPRIGVHSWRSICSQSQDTSLHGITGTVQVVPYTDNNPLYLHGPLHVSANHRYLQHEDQTPFFWLADTWWMGLCHRLHWPDEFQALTADRKQKGFTAIQIVAGLYPDMFPFDPRGANEAGYPWETNYTRINPHYFDAADRRLGYLVEQGLTPCIVGAWGYFMPWMGVDKMKAHWRYLIARYGAWPVVWCAAGEANLPWYLAPGFPYDDRNQVHNWTEVMKYIRATDPFHRLLTVHPTAIQQYTARHATDDPELLDFDMLQTPHGQAEAVPTTLRAVRDSVSAAPRLPVIDGEASYEMLGDNLPTEWTRRMFWLCMMNGAVGHTYGANGIWQCNRPGDPHGASPHGGNYGKIPWNEAMHLPGSTQLGLAKAFLEQFPWYRFEPHPEWVTAAAEPLIKLDDCSWIWFPEGNPAKDAPAQKRFFRRSFTLPSTNGVAAAMLRVSADDWCEVFLNGEALGTCDNWRQGKQFNSITQLLKVGTNVIAIEAENKPATVPANPAGLLACLEINFKASQSLRVATDTSWRCDTSASAAWKQSSLDDSNWSKALVVARYGDGPWGRLTGSDAVVSEPQATGIPDSLRIIYVPQREMIHVRDLSPNTTYAAFCFDPVTGNKTALGSVHSDGQGIWSCPPPLQKEQDWVLALEQGTQ